MQDSELGEIPVEWEVKPLDTVAHYQNGLALQKFRPEDENDFLPVVKIAQLKKGFADGEEKASPNIKTACIIDDGDVIFSWSGTLVVDTWCGGKAALNQHLFKVTSDDYPKWLYYYFTKHHLAEFQRIAQAKAVTMGHIKREHLKKALCAVPDSDLIAHLGKIIKPLVDKAVAVRLENRTLAELRDTLLPKLLSGELQLSTEDLA
jgi:type I restriction enzyme S subunit